MKVNNISSANAFGRIFLCSEVCRHFKKNSDINLLTQRLVRGRNASIIGNDVDGFFMSSADNVKVFLGQKPSVKSISKIIDGLNSAR